MGEISDSKIYKLYAFFFFMEGDRIWKAQEVPFVIFSCKVTSLPESMVYHYQPVASLVSSAASSINKPFLSYFWFHSFAIYGTNPCCLTISESVS